MIDKFSSSLFSAAKSSARPATTDAATAAPTILPSLGASGAIYSTVVISALAFPDAEVSLVFPPTPSFPIEYGVGGLVLLDCIGALRGWRYGPRRSGFLTGCADDYARLTGSLIIMRIWEARCLEHFTIRMVCACGMPCAFTHSNQTATNRSCN